MIYKEKNKPRIVQSISIFWEENPRGKRGGCNGSPNYNWQPNSQWAQLWGKKLISLGTKEKFQVIATNVPTSIFFPQANQVGQLHPS